MPWGFIGQQPSQVDIQPPQVVGVAMDTVASYPLSLNHSVRYVQDRLVLIGQVTMAAVMIIIV